MKKLLALTLMLAHFEARCSINPDKSLYSFIDIFNPKNEVLSKEMKARVKLTRYDDQGDLQNNKETKEIPLADYETFLKQAQGVFEVHRLTSTMLFHGTAFHIGEGLILTNQHVLSRDFTNFTSCDGLMIKNHNGAFIKCRKVHFCYQLEDICLIELEMSEARAEALPKLRLTTLSQENSDSAVITVIGNSQGKGIHVSAARGISHHRGGYTFYAAARDGNSGGPILNEKGEVIGVIRTESKLVKLEGGPSGQVNITTIRELMMEKDEVQLEKFNEALASMNFMVDSQSVNEETIGLSNLMYSLRKDKELQTLLGKVSLPFSEIYSSNLNVEELKALFKAEPKILEAIDRIAAPGGLTGRFKKPSSEITLFELRQELQDDVVGLKKLAQTKISLEKLNFAEIKASAMKNVTLEDPASQKKLAESLSNQNTFSRVTFRPYKMAYILNVQEALKDDKELLETFNGLLSRAGSVASNNAASSVVIIPLLQKALKKNTETLEKFNRALIDAPVNEKPILPQEVVPSPTQVAL